MTARRAPIGRLLDLAVAVPTCSLVATKRALPLMARLGTLGTVRVIERVSTAVHDIRTAGPAPVGAPLIADETVSASRRPSTAPAAEPGSAFDPAAVVDPDRLPIEGYDDLAARQVVDRLESLGPDDLAAIDAYERSHRGRSTVLGKISMLTS